MTINFKKIFDLFVDFIPTPIRILIKGSKADKFIFRMILNMRGDLLGEVENYRLQINSNEKPEDEIKQISKTIDNKIEQLPKDDILPGILSHISQVPPDPV